MTPLRRWLIPSVLALLLGAGLLASSSAATATTSPTPASATHVLSVHFPKLTVRVTVPRTWHVARTALSEQCGCGSAYNPVCVVAKGDYDRNPYDCKLVIGGGLGFQGYDLPLPTWRLPSCRSWDTSYEADSRLGRWPAEYRIFLDRCHDRKAEQWLSVTYPSVGLWHPLSWGADDRAAAEAARSIRVSRHLVTKRASDLGRVRNVQLVSGRPVITVDRVVQSLDGSWINESDKTYRYRIQPQNHGATWAGCLGNWSMCSAKELRRQFLKGAHPADGTRPLAGHVVLITVDDRSSRLHDVSNPGRNYRFVSSGDHGPCHC